MTISDDPVGSARWYCVHSKPRSEAVALQNLQRQGFECLLPRIARDEVRAGRRRTLIEPLFPGYLFLRADPARQSLAPVRSTVGALGLVRFGNQPGEVPQRLIERICADADADGLIVPARDKLQPGDAVDVRWGAFAGLRGVYLQPRGEQRAIVLLELLGSVQRVLLPCDDLQKLPAACFG